VMGRFCLIAQNVDVSLLAIELIRNAQRRQ
jgi:hypothetical protein